MNKTRRKQLEKIAAQLEELENQISELSSQEQEAIDNLPESFQYGEKGDTMTEAIDEMETVVSELCDLRDRLLFL
jgi:phage shock protein A